MAEAVGLGDRLDVLVSDLSHGEQRQLEVGMARAADPKLMMLDEPAAGLSRAERVKLTELLLALDPAITLILIEHDMDVALRVGALGDDDARRPRDRRRHARRDPRQRDRSTSSTSEATTMTEPLLAVEDVNGYYGTAHVLQGVSFEMGAEPVALIGRNGMGKSTLCAAIVGPARARRAGSVRLDGRRADGQAGLQDRRRRHRLRAAGPAAVRVADRRRAPADRRRALEGRVDARARLRAVPAPGRAQDGQRARRSRAASSRCSRSAARC